jgi:hypothetical protein
MKIVPVAGDRQLDDQGGRGPEASMCERLCVSWRESVTLMINQFLTTQ